MTELIIPPITPMVTVEQADAQARQAAEDAITKVLECALKWVKTQDCDDNEVAAFAEDLLSTLCPDRALWPEWVEETTYEVEYVATVNGTVSVTVERDMLGSIGTDLGDVLQSAVENEIYGVDTLHDVDDVTVDSIYDWNEA